MIDVVRRVVETTAVARAWQITHFRKAQGLEALGWKKEAERERTMPRPWEQDVKGEPLSVQEWTGPAVFTDAVLSYVSLPHALLSFVLLSLRIDFSVIVLPNPHA